MKERANRSNHRPHIFIDTEKVQEGAVVEAAQEWLAARKAHEEAVCASVVDPKQGTRLHDARARFREAGDALAEAVDALEGKGQ